MVNYRQRQQALRKGFFGNPLLSACLLTLPVLVPQKPPGRTSRQAGAPPAPWRTVPDGPKAPSSSPQRNGTPCPGSSSNRLLLQREESGPLPASFPGRPGKAPAPIPGVSTLPPRSSGWGRTHGTQSGSQPQKLVGFRMAGKLRRLRQPGSRLPHEGLPPENIHPPAKPLLRGAPL